MPRGAEVWNHWYSYRLFTYTDEGIIRKQLNIPFLGETRTNYGVVVADVELKGLSTDVSHQVPFFGSLLMIYEQRWHSWGEFGKSMYVFVVESLHLPDVDLLGYLGVPRKRQASGA